MCNQDKKNAKMEDYRQLLIELYKENQSFLNKAIFAISSLAIPFLFKGAAEPGINLWVKYIFTISLFGFFIVISLQVLSLKYARDGCDDGLSAEEEIRNKSVDLFDKARNLDIWREKVFLLSLFLIIPAFLFNIITMENNMSDSTKTPNEDAKQVGTSNKKVGTYSYVPPKAVEKSFVPPKAVVTDNQVPGSGGDNNSTQTSQNNEGKKE